MGPADRHTASMFLSSAEEKESYAKTHNVKTAHKVKLQLTSFVLGTVTATLPPVKVGLTSPLSPRQGSTSSRFSLLREPFHRVTMTASAIPSKALKS